MASSKRFLVFCVYACFVVGYCCPKDTYYEPGKGCLSCDVLCLKSEEQCLFMCPDYYNVEKQNKPDTILKDLDQPPLVDVADNKVEKQVPIGSQEKGSSEKGIGVGTVIAIILGSLILLLLLLGGGYKIKRYREGPDRKQRNNAEEDIELHSLNGDEAVEHVDNTAAQDAAVPIDPTEDNAANEEVDAMIQNPEDSETENDDTVDEDDEGSDAGESEVLQEVVVHAPVCVGALPLDASEQPGPSCSLEQAGPSQPESQIGTMEQSITESQMHSPNGNRTSDFTPTQANLDVLTNVPVPTVVQQLAVHQTQYAPEPSSTAVGTSASCIAQADDGDADPAQTARKSRLCEASSGGQSREICGTEVTREQYESASESVQAASGLSPRANPAQNTVCQETLPLSIQATPSYENLHDSEGAEGGAEYSVEAIDQNNQQHLVSELRSLEPYWTEINNTRHGGQTDPTVNGVDRHYHADVNRMFDHPQPPQQRQDGLPYHHHLQVNGIFGHASQAPQPQPRQPQVEEEGEAVADADSSSEESS